MFLMASEKLWIKAKMLSCRNFEMATVGLSPIKTSSLVNSRTKVMELRISSLLECGVYFINISQTVELMEISVLINSMSYCGAQLLKARTKDLSSTFLIVVINSANTFEKLLLIRSYLVRPWILAILPITSF
ncbi:hypothetical protein WICPIJ_005010 [Wickerhamomyces pijperi]|uniref:Uncharacterized protein n=1 Tax=Wickerhamomyces pijperi TaxID=599730 RepID=A0A9P8Q4P8_WICPI|nr:hypothetical protein WICPIJ_005010 [Wickerhamomyces pijperi]